MVNTSFFVYSDGVLFQLRVFPGFLFGCYGTHDFGCEYDRYGYKRLIDIEVTQ